ncbi:exonuclease domain-containing protein [Chloroflexota bacterium]
MLKNLRLERPIAFIDIETTGSNPLTDRIIELSILKLHPDGNEEIISQKINPAIPIPTSATAIHGITDTDVENEPKFHQYAKYIQDFLKDCDISGFNVIRFDLPCLEAEFARANVDFSRKGRYLIDSMVIFHRREPRDLEAAYRKYCQKEMKNAHSAEEDVKASAEVLDGQLKMYEDLPRSVSELSALYGRDEQDYIDFEGRFIWVNGEAVCNFGKEHIGRKLEDIAINDPKYLRWIARSNFSVQVKNMVTKALEGEFPKRVNPPVSIQ